MDNRIIRTPQARLDLIQIWHFIAGDNEAAADKFLDRIDRALANMRDNPLIGRARPELGPDIRSFPVGNYILFYRVMANSVELVRALNGHRDIHSDDMD